MFKEPIKSLNVALKVACLRWQKFKTPSLIQQLDAYSKRPIVLIPAANIYLWLTVMSFRTYY